MGHDTGKSGKLPGKLAPEIVEIAKKKDLNSIPMIWVLYPNELDRFIKEMKENGWGRGRDDEELFEFAMHEKQYREYMSGQAKEQFNKDLLERMKKLKTVAMEVLPNISALLTAGNPAP